MNEYWARSWDQANSHLRVNGSQLLNLADTLGWELYPEERQTLVAGSDVEIYLTDPLDELDVISFGAAIQTLQERLEARNARHPRMEKPPKLKDNAHHKRRDRRDDNSRDRRWR